MTRRDYRHRDSERGAILIMAAGMIVVLMGFVGLGLDTGSLFNHKRALQSAADGGAYQGGHELHRGNTSQITTAARAGSAENGYPQGANGVDIDVYHPPVSGFYVGDVSAVEVIVNQPSPITFMTLFGFTAPTVPARAVAWAGADSDFCIHILEKTEADAFDYQSSAVLEAPKCSLMVNSSSSWAGHLTSNSYAHVADAAFVGGYVEESSSDLDAEGYIGTGVVSPGDPLCPMPGVNCMPQPSDYAMFGCNRGIDNEWDQPVVDLLPGVYCGKTTLKNATHGRMAPGLYTFVGGPLSVEGDSILEGPVPSHPQGVMLYFTEDEGAGYPLQGFSFSSNAQAILTASSVCPDPPLCDANPYYGILMFVDPSAGDPDEEFRLESNTGTHYLNGTIYFPNHIFNLESSTHIESGCPPVAGGPQCPDGSDYLTIVVRRLIAESNSVLNTRSAFPSGGAVLKKLALVE